MGMSKLGLKKLTVDNWLTGETFMSGIVSVSLRDGSQSPITAEQWAERFLKIRLSEEVPVDILERFEIARGAALYGFFFYPLFTQALLGLLVVAEAAVSTRCDDLNIPSRLKTLDDKLTYLHDERKLGLDEYDKWDLIRKVRNLTVHSKHQNILLPMDVRWFFYHIAERINLLFALK
jgi:hypothetical protein